MTVPGVIPIGVDAFGDLVVWDPLWEGSVLTVRGSPQSGKTEFATLVHRLGGVAVSVPVREDNDFKLRAEDVRAAITERTAAVIINSPSIPWAQ